MKSQISKFKPQIPGSTVEQALGFGIWVLGLFLIIFLSRSEYNTGQVLFFLFYVFYCVYCGSKNFRQVYFMKAELAYKTKNLKAKNSHQV